MAKRAGHGIESCLVQARALEYCDPGGRLAGHRGHGRGLGPAAVRRQTVPPHSRLGRSARPTRPLPRYLAEFLERFPKDARAAEIEQLQAGLQCQSLRQELSVKVRTLTDLEQAYLDGMDLAEQHQWTAATARFQQIVEGLESRVLSAADRRLLDRASTCWTSRSVPRRPR